MSDQPKSAYIDMILTLTTKDCERANAVAKVINDRNRMRYHLTPITDRPRIFESLTLDEKVTEVYQRLLALESNLIQPPAPPPDCEAPGEVVSDPFLVATREVSS